MDISIGFKSFNECNLYVVSCTFPLLPDSNIQLKENKLPTCPLYKCPSSKVCSVMS